MNLKLINKIFICFLFSFLISCESLEFLSEQDTLSEKDTDIREVKEIKTRIILNHDINRESIDDFYNLADLKILNNKRQLLKIRTFNTKRKKTQNSKNLISFIYQNYFIFLDLKSNLNIYDLKDLNLINSIDLNIYIDSEEAYPTSIARIKNNFYIVYSEGIVLNINLKGELIWLKDLKEIMKTPIKIYNNNLILLTSNDIISMNPITGDINWEFSYGNNEILQAMGGDLINLNHILYFILPDGEMGEINTIFREKNKSIFSEYDFQPSINNSLDKLHSFDNTLSYFDQKKYLYSFDIGKNIILSDGENLNNVHSFKFYNNSIILLDKNNLLKSLNIKNRKIFWEIDLSNAINMHDKIIYISSLSDSLILLFESGNIIELNYLNGSIISSEKLKIDKITHLISNTNFLMIYHNNNKITLFTQ
jgi:hypothetical protein